jgi:hypothetical protein
MYLKQKMVKYVINKIIENFDITIKVGKYSSDVSAIMQSCDVFKTKTQKCIMKENNRTSNLK